METDRVLEQIFSHRKPSLRQLIRNAIADLPPSHKQIAGDRFKDIHFCVLTMVRQNKFSERDAIAGTLAAIDFADPNFKLDFKAIASKAPKRYIVNPLG